MNQVSNNKSINLSEHFTLGEVTKSRHAEVYNIPSHVAIENLKRVCGWLEELRFAYNTLYCLKPGEDYETSENVEPIVINSGYRSPQLNKKVGGSPTSNHLTGCAVDIRCTGIEQALRYAVILMDYADKTKQDFDELLIERNLRGNYWLHFAVRPPEDLNRRRINFIKIGRGEY